MAMAQHKVTTTMYSLGFIEDYIENTIGEPEEGNEQGQQVLAAMRVLSEGVVQLINENGRLRNRIILAENALKT
jgi:hypothetical protein